MAGKPLVLAATPSDTHLFCQHVSTVRHGLCWKAPRLVACALRREDVTQDSLQQQQQNRDAARRHDAQLMSCYKTEGPAHAPPANTFSGHRLTHALPRDA